MDGQEGLDSLLNLFTDLNTQVESLVRERSSSSIPSIPSVRNICPEDGLFTLFQPRDCAEIHAKAERLEREVESVTSELNVMRQKVEQLERFRKTDSDDIARLSALATWLRRSLRAVAIEGDLLALKPFSLMAETPVEDCKFIQVMRLIIDARSEEGAPVPCIPPNPSIAAVAACPPVEDLPFSASPVQNRENRSSKKKQPPPPLVLQSSELREKIQQARMIVKGRPILVARN